MLSTILDKVFPKGPTDPDSPGETFRCYYHPRYTGDERPEKEYWCPICEKYSVREPCKCGFGGKRGLIFEQHCLECWMVRAMRLEDIMQSQGDL